ncbi:MAG: hypothetical protein M3238_03490 [Actinomycetota bacterium]|nr:hypothetical protein [Actinomycetota bacterium]
MRIMRAALALLTAALVVGPAVTGSAQVQPGCPGVTTRGLWTTIVAPVFDDGPQQLSAYAVDPVMPSTIYATNGKGVMRTVDGGCSWEERFGFEVLPNLDVPISSANSTIMQIEIPESRFAHSTIYLLVEERVGPVVRPHVIVSRDGGSTWKASDDGLPLVTGDVLGIHVAPDSPAFIYLHTRLPNGKDEVHASMDGGVHWERRSSPTDGVAAFDMAVDPQNSNELWFWGASGLHHSTNGGRSRALIDFAAPPTALVDVFHAPGAPSRVMAFEVETSTFAITETGGRTWRRINGPITGNPLSIAHANDSEDVVFSMHQGIYRLQRGGLAGGQWLDITPEGPPKDIVELSADRTPTPSIFGRTDTSIERFGGLNVTANVGPITIVPPEFEGGIPEMVPKRVKLKLAHDRSRRVRFRLDLPPRPTRLDVFFLVDTSSSMDSSIAGLRVGMQDIIEQLGRLGLDVQFGVGEIKDYPIPGYGDAAQGDFPYRLNQEITADGAALEAALERLEASGGGATDQPESQLTGLYQAATGAGEPGFVPAGHDAGFRDEALKVIVNITDAAFHKEPQHPSPSFEATAAQLRDRGILQVGLSVFGPNGSKGYPDLVAMAEQTETTAPVGVDCDGNGSVDIPAGQPLVCDVADADYDGTLNLAPAIVATLEAVTEEVAVALLPQGKNRVDELVPRITPDVLTAVDLTEENSLTFDVTFRCPDALLGTTQDVKLEAHVAQDLVATSLARIVCRPLTLGKPKDDAIPPVLLVPATVLPAALAVPPAPPPPVFENIPASQSAAQAQGAMATETQEEVQVAVARQRSTFSSAREEIYEFSSYKEKPRGVPPGFLYLSAAAMALAYGVAMSARHRVRVALSRRRR